MAHHVEAIFLWAGGLLSIQLRRPINEARQKLPNFQKLVEQFSQIKLNKLTFHLPYILYEGG